MAMTHAWEIAGSVKKSSAPIILHFGMASGESPWEIGLRCDG
jgi:hypothetical protein